MNFHLLVLILLTETVPNGYRELLDHQLELLAVHVVVNFYFELRFEVLFSRVHLQKDFDPKVLRFNINEDLVSRVQLFDHKFIFVLELDALSLQHEFVFLVLKQCLVLLHLFYSDTAQTLEMVVCHDEALFDLLHQVVEVLPLRDLDEQTVLRHGTQRHIDIEYPLVVLVPPGHVDYHLVLLDNEIAHTSNLVVHLAQLFVVIQRGLGPQVLQRIVKFWFKL